MGSAVDRRNNDDNFCVIYQEIHQEKIKQKKPGKNQILLDCIDHFYKYLRIQLYIVNIHSYTPLIRPYFNKI